mmetsp:Transcript_31265/g.60394  ORF Transcript_31265/g.60394 Transcript_31265/m.60394 type:complete len:488 (+) Transcript_31265:66-1529(+)
MEPIGSVRWASEGDSDSVSLEENHASPCVNATAGCSTVPQMVEIQLDAELLGMLSRRSRRRIRDIQASCQVRTKLDKMRGVLQVVGNENGIQAVRRQLESFGGPRKPVPTAVWAELMRTRMQSTTAFISVASIQEETGCRVHIERSRCEVRLFGDLQGVRQASERIDDLTSHCVEASVPLPGSYEFPSEELQNLAHDNCVTFFQETGKIVIYGLKSAVSKAVVSLKDAMPSRPSEATDGSGPEENRASSELSVTEAAQAAAEGSEASHPPPSTVLAAMPVPVTQANAQQGACSAANAARCRSGHLQCCPTCGAARFCTECGAPVGNHDVQNALPPPAANRVHWQQQQQQQSPQRNSPAGGKGNGAANRRGGGARARGVADMDPQTASWMPPQMVLVPYDGTMAMQGTAAHCSPGMVPFALVGMDHWYSATGPGQVDPQAFMAQTMFAGQTAPVDANTVSTQASVCGHPTEESLPWAEGSKDSLPPMH